jgi:hypothetical protein
LKGPRHLRPWVAAALVAAAGPGARPALAQDVISLAPADLEPVVSGPASRLRESALRLGAQLDVGRAWLSPAVVAVGSHASLQVVTDRVRYVPRLALQLRGPPTGHRDTLPERIRTNGGVLSAELSSFVVARPWPHLGVFARAHVRPSLVQAGPDSDTDDATQPDRITVGWLAVGGAAGFEIGPVLLVAHVSVYRTLVDGDAPADFVHELDRPDLAFELVGRMATFLWLFARARPLVTSFWERDGWAVGLAGGFAPFEEDEGE